MRHIRLFLFLFIPSLILLVSGCGTLTVPFGQTAQSITFASVSAQTVGTPLTLSATASSGLPVSFTSTTPGVCTVAGTTATFVASGTCTIDANQAGNSTFAAAPQVAQSFTVNAVLTAQTISFANPGTQTVGTPLMLSATASSGLPVTFTSATPGVCTVSGTTATFIASGTCTIDANQAGNSTYAAAPQVAQSFTVNAVAQTITFANPGTQIVGTPLTLSATASSGLPVSFTSATPAVCTVSGTTATLIAAGTCTVDANQAGNSTFAAAPQVAQSFTVQLAQTITFANPGTQMVGTPLTLSATASSGLPVSFTSATPSVCTVSGTTATFVASGTCTIDANQAGNSTYAAAPQVEQSFTVQTTTVYIAGFVYGVASLYAEEWEVAPGSSTVTATALPMPSGMVYSFAFGIAVSGSDVYFTGATEGISASSNQTGELWLNGTPATLPAPSGEASCKAWGIALSGSDVYVAGETWNSPGAASAMYWLNGVPTILPTPSGMANSIAWGIAVSDGNVYVAGDGWNGGPAGPNFDTALSSSYTAAYWVNGALQALSVPSGTANSDAYAIAVSGTDVYVAGTVLDSTGSSTATYWLNGALQSLSLPSGMTDSSADAIEVSGSDVYVVGQVWNSPGKYIAAYWKNGVPTVLPVPTGMTNSTGSGISVSGSDVYVSGAVWAGSGEYIAAYWKNGTATVLQLPSGALGSFGSQILVSTQ